MTDRIDFGGRPWHALPREVLRDERLSLKARGALVTLLSHEEGWVRSAIATLMREARCGRAAAQAAMRELRDHGYAELVRDRQLDGQLRSHYVVFAEPRRSGPRTSEFPVDGKPDRRETRPTGNQAAVVEALPVEPLDVERPSHLAPRKRDALFEAVADVCGMDWRRLTKTARGSLNGAVGQLREVGATPDDVFRRANNWPYETPLTPPGLAKQWPALEKVRPSGRDPVRHIHAMAEQMREAGA